MTTNLAHTPEQVAREMMESVALRGVQLEAHLERALSPQYWQALVPELSVGKETVADLAGVAALAPEVRQEVIERVGEEGYFHTSPILPALVTGRMCAAVTRLVDEGWPPVFAWIYDEFWRVSRTPPLVELFSAVLGNDYRQTPYVWTHVVPGRRGAAGWPPHVDNRGKLFRLTVWIPLSDATVETGCICVIPKHLVPRGLEGAWGDHEMIPMREALGLLHASRPLPARAGSVLGWHAGLLHWGSSRQKSGEPRVSLSMELVPAAVVPHQGDDTLAAADRTLPSHHARLRIIAEAIVMYQSSEPRVSRYAALAGRLLEKT
jgi:Phytanoyl-CoA dioxygenase (PhyH)